MNTNKFYPLTIMLTAFCVLSGCNQKERLSLVNRQPNAENQSLELLGNTSIEIELIGSDPDGDELTYSLVSEPEFGILTGDAPSFVYTPNADVNQVDQFEFFVSDGKLRSEPARVTLTIKQYNATPITSTDSYSTVGGCSLIVSIADGVISNDSDADGDSLVATLESGPEHGSVTLEQDGSFVYSPTLPLQATDSFTYKVSDGRAESESTQVNIAIDNDGIIVNTVEDAAVADDACSLRKAIEIANTGVAQEGCNMDASLRRILFGMPNGRYLLAPNQASEETADGVEAETEPLEDDDTNEQGDLDISSEVTLVGCGFDKTIIDGNGRVRVFHILSSGELNASELSIDNGAVQGFGAGLYNTGTSTLVGVSFVNNHAIGHVGHNGGTTGGGGGGGGGGSLGGAVYNHSDANLSLSPGQSPCILSNNSATGGRGGNGYPNGSVGQGRGGDGGGSNAGLGSETNGQTGGFGSGGGGGGGSWQGTYTGGLGGFAGGGGGAGARTGGGTGQEGALSVFAGGKGGRGGCSAAPGGGGGGALGGALFNNAGVVILGQCHFESNAAIGGPRGNNAYCGVQPEAGLGYGGAVFNYGGVMDAAHATYSDNLADEDPNLHDYGVTTGSPGE